MTEVKINAKIIEQGAREQIDLMKNSPAFHGLISIMPDVHQGIGAVIGFTGKFNNVVIPNVIGVDIGCGVTAYPLGKKNINFEELDKHIRKVIPLGFNSHKDDKHFKDFKRNDPLLPHIKRISIDLCDKITKDFLLKNYRKEYIDPILQLGTLGGGNHFIEIGENKDKEKYLVIHSGSRNLGQKVARWYQGEAIKFCKNAKISTPRHLEYLPLEYGGDNYIKHMHLTQLYARLNREIMIIKILKFFDINFDKNLIIESTHNYISEKDNIVRKGAISAHKDEQVIIPLNMADGTVIGTGKGNSSYNNSAPHGAGRIYGRNVMKQKLRSGEITMEMFKNKMEGIFSTSIHKHTIDESPMAYKDFEDIKEYLEETVEIQTILKPIYNLKA